MANNRLHILQVGDVLVSPDILTECFCCDLAACKGACCVEGESGAPLLPEEVGEMEDALPAVSDLLPAAALAKIEAEGVAYIDMEGDLVSTIIDGKDCAFAFHENGCCFCALERRCREGRTSWPKPISCALYPIREKRLAGGLVGLNYHRWSVCAAAREKGKREGLRIYEFLREPLVRRFGAEWYAELEALANALKKENLL